MAALTRIRHGLVTRLIKSRPVSASAMRVEYEEEESEWETETESEGCKGKRGVQWVIMGHPMANKHVYAQRLSKVLEVPYISMGTLVRQELHPSSSLYKKIDLCNKHVYAQRLLKVLEVLYISIATLVRQELHPSSSLYKKIANSVNQGKLVPEDIIFGLLSKRLEECYVRGETGFILDGLPRTRTQAAILDQIADIDLVVNFKCTENSLKQKLEDKFYSQSPELLGLSNPGLKSSNTDSEHIWKKKVSNFAEQNKPLEDYYRQQRKLFNFQVGGAPGETWQGLLTALHLQHMNVVTSSPKLTI